MTKADYFEFQKIILETNEEILMWGSWVQFSAYIATHRIWLEQKREPISILDADSFKGKHNLEWLDKLASGYFEDEPEEGLLAMYGYGVEMSDTADFARCFLEHLQNEGGDNFVKYQNALTFNSEYMDKL